MNLHNRVVILTGATQGIGRATAQLLAQQGCKLALAARSVDALTDLVAELQQSGGQAAAIPTDMGDPAQAAALVRKTIEAFIKIDVVINNAAVGVSGKIEDLVEAEARRAMDVNYFGPVTLIQAAIPYLKANPDGGLIINISSIVSRRAVPGIGGYCASKGALDNMTESLRTELAGDNIRVSTVYPGVTATGFTQNSLGTNPTRRRHGMKGVPPERVARAISKTIRRERRDVFVTLFDRLFVAVSAVWPGLIDKMLSSYMSR